MKSNLNFYQLQSGLDNFPQSWKLWIWIRFKFLKSFVEIYSLVAPQQFLHNPMESAWQIFVYKGRVQKVFSKWYLRWRKRSFEMECPEISLENKYSSYRNVGSKIGCCIEFRAIQISCEGGSNSQFRSFARRLFYVIDASSKLNHLPPLVLKWWE